MIEFIVDIIALSAAIFIGSAAFDAYRHKDR